MKNIILDENGNIEDENPLKAELDAHEKELEEERAARIARQREPEAYIPDPIHPDLPYNSNRVSGFEFHYGEIAFYGVVILCVYLFVFYLISSLPM